MKVSDPKCYRYADFEKATAWQANGDGGWETIGNEEPMTIPVNGYLAVYLTNATSFADCEGCLNSEGDVYFDKLKIKFTRGNLKEETHYYPFGLPMAGMGSSAAGMTLNRQKYQANEYITESGLNWMSFGARQYDPQIGRFLSVDPLADAGGQDMLSPYQAMGNNPVSLTDPGGMKSGQPGGDLPGPPGGGPPVLSDGLYQSVVGPPGGLWQVAIAGPLMGFSSSALADMAGNINTDPMNLSFWYDHTIGSDGKVYTLFRDMNGDVYGATLGETSPMGASIVGTMTMSEGNGSGGGASDDKGGSPDGDGDSQSSNGNKSNKETDANAVAVGTATGGLISELTTGIEVTLEVTGTAIASGFATVALVFLPTKIAAPSMEMREIDPYGDSRTWKEEIPDKTNRIRPVNFNNKNYFPQGNGNDIIKWFVRFGAMGAAYKKFWYDPGHPNKN